MPSCSLLVASLAFSYFLEHGAGSGGVGSLSDSKGHTREGKPGTLVIHVGVVHTEVEMGPLCGHSGSGGGGTRNVW